MRLAWLALLTCLTVASVGRADGELTAHLLAGARAFRAGQYEAALVEFRAVERLGATPELGLYLGPTLYKLGRLDEARRVLGAVHRSSQPDAVADYYLALTYYKLGYARLARAVFAGLDARDAGPKLAAGAQRFLADLDKQTVPPESAARFLQQMEHDGRVDLDAAAEAFLRAPPGSPERARAAQALVHGAGVEDASDAVIQRAAEELRPGAPGR